MSHIIVKDIHKSYKKNQVLNGLSFECKNEILFLAGKNGAGKTTFIRLALGLDKEDKGSIDFDGERNLGVVFDTPSLYQNLTCNENINILCTGYLDDKPYIDKILKTLRIDSSLLKKRVGKCSFGQQHRISVAIALIRKPVYLFLDEPTIGLDPESWEMVRECILINKEKQNGSVIITGQDYFEMRNLADKILVLEKGKAKFCESIPSFINRFKQRIKLITDKEIVFDSELGKYMEKKEMIGNEHHYYFENRDQVLDLIHNGNIKILHLSTEHIDLKDAFLRSIDIK